MTIADDVYAWLTGGEPAVKRSIEVTEGAFKFRAVLSETIGSEDVQWSAVGDSPSEALQEALWRASI